MTAPQRIRGWLAALAVLALAGCGKESTDSRMLELALETSPNRLDPAFAVDTAEGEICALVFDGLVGFGADGAMVPGIARRWETEDGGRRTYFTSTRANAFPAGASRRAMWRRFARLLAAHRVPRAWVLTRIRGGDAFHRGERFDTGARAAAIDALVEVNEPFALFPCSRCRRRVVDVTATGGGNAGGSGPWVVSSSRGDPSRWRQALPPACGARHRGVLPCRRNRSAHRSTIGAIDTRIPDAGSSFHDDRNRGARGRGRLRVFYVGLSNRRAARDRRALNPR
jgi:hypothetical protein